MSATPLVWIVDSDEHSRKWAGVVLLTQSVRCRTFENAGEALLHYTRTPEVPACVLMALSDMGTDSVAIARLRAKGYRGPVIALADDPSEVPDTLIACGLSSVLPGPLQPAAAKAIAALCPETRRASAA
jgi:FixJ family two-component response regulator